MQADELDVEGAGRTFEAAGNVAGEMHYRGSGWQNGIDIGRHPVDGRHEDRAGTAGLAGMAGRAAVFAGWRAVRSDLLVGIILRTVMLMLDGMTGCGVSVDVRRTVVPTRFARERVDRSVSLQRERNQQQPYEKSLEDTVHGRSLAYRFAQMNSA